MSNLKLPPASVRVDVQNAASVLVKKGVVTQARIDALLSNPVLTASERDAGKALIQEMKGAVHGSRGDELTRNIATFAKTIDLEIGSSSRVDVARKALAGGAINEAEFRGLTGTEPSLRSLLTTAISAAKVDRQLERVVTKLADTSVRGSVLDRPALVKERSMLEQRQRLLKAIACDPEVSRRTEGALDRLRGVVAGGAAGAIFGTVFGVFLRVIGVDPEIALEVGKGAFMLYAVAGTVLGGKRLLSTLQQAST